MISKRTILVFYDVLTTFSTLNRIQQLFESEHIFESESHTSNLSGQRRTLANSYVSTLDLNNPGDIRKLLNIFELFYIENSDNNYFLVDSSWKQFLMLLERDGFIFKNGKIHELNETNIQLDVNVYTNNYEIPHVQKDWERALTQAKTDPEDSITATRSMLESTLKWILDDIGLEYEETESLNQLYKKVANKLKLSPDQHGEDIFKQILGSINGVIGGLGSLRNAYGDSHGKGKVYYKPSERHAKFAINLSGTMCIYLLETYFSYKEVPTN
ncbi:abortive infection family protein [Ornithinibacillus bavariensis]|uniref:Abortive infection protein n=1 Tax=Ornithinibacillus bavariensis TaxID=545502 RepID=A0A920C834_9BACI|nr:abortive infection family protein [Ornithinibacillus bavariensis]GIO28273.1 abortive infection protein [Ornithinibacillus bavariensis]